MKETLSYMQNQSEDYVKDFIDPAVQGTLGLLRSAAKSLSVKRIVITSSVVVLDFEKPGRISGIFSISIFKRKN